MSSRIGIPSSLHWVMRGYNTHNKRTHRSKFNECGYLQSFNPRQQDLMPPIDSYK